MKLSVIIPVHNGGENFRCCLKALQASRCKPSEIIVVNDSSTDESGDLARTHDAMVLNIESGPHGPAYARNRGAEAAQGEILVFVDADVAVHIDTLEKINRYFAETAELSALFGSYDADPPAEGFVTRYKNLLHHHIHQNGRREASTFWAGCGAIRREVFQSVGGFDPSYRLPSIEDIDLGVRLRRAGHAIWLCPDIQATHLKRWTLGSMLRSDIFDRAIPWTQLIVRTGLLPADLNLNIKGRMSAFASWVALVFAGGGVWFPSALIGAMLGLVVLAIINGDLYWLFIKRHGARFALGAAGLHLLYFLYSSLVFIIGSVLFWLKRH